MSNLLELAARCEKATGPDRELDALIVVALDLRPDWLKNSIGELWVDKQAADLIAVRFRDSCIKQRGQGNPPIGNFAEFTASIDAAMTLIPAAHAASVEWSPRFPGSAWLFPPDNKDDIQFEAEASSPALALCAVALRARDAVGARSTRGADVDK